MMRSPIRLIGLVLLLPAWLPAQDPGLDSLRVLDLRAHIGFLASDELQGRAAGTEYNDIAFRYIAMQFLRAGLQPVADGGTSWFQPFEVRAPVGGKARTRNVVGVVPGTDPDLRDQYLIIGAHHDHVGLGKFGSRGGTTPQDKIHNGADDNASGTAGVLELAEAFALAPARRSILFMTFSGEEMGLLGSFYYVRNPLVPLEDTVAMLNFDMIGRSRDDYLFIGGVGTSPIWEGLISRHLDAAGLRVERGSGGSAPSDNTPFYREHLPVLFFFTNVHEDYHRASDEPQYIAYDAELKILRAAYGLIREVADAEARPEFQRAPGMAMPKDFMQLMRLPARRRDLADTVVGASRERGRLGVEVAEVDGGVVVRQVDEGGAASRAGLRAGDRILQVEDTEVADLAALTRVLAGKRKGDRVSLLVQRDGERVGILVTLR